MDGFALYEGLWHLAERLGVRVRYRGLMESAGAFQVVHGTPVIFLRRRRYEGNGDAPTGGRNDGERLEPDELRQETFTLAHECGHYLSYRERTPRTEWNAYTRARDAWDGALAAVPRDGSDDDYNEALRDASRRRLTHADMDLILTEEERAWDIGRELLEELGYRELHLIDEQKDRALAIYRYRLGIGPLP